MANDKKKMLKISGAIENAYRFNFLLGETLTARLYSATDLKTGEAANLWISKDKLSLDNNKFQPLLDHLKFFDKITPPISNFDSYGYDSEGRIFLIFSYNFNANFLSPRGNFDEMVRRLYRAIRLTSVLHNQKIFIGDLNDKSFYLTPSGTVQFCAGLRSFAHDGGQLITGLSKSNLLYIAPELVNNQFSATSDVYSLGVLGFKTIFDKIHLEPTYKSGQLSVVSDVSKLEITPDLNNLLRVLSKATESNPDDRYQSATHLMNELGPALDKKVSKPASEKTYRAPEVERTSILPAVRVKGRVDNDDELIQEQIAKQEKVKRIIAWAIVLIFILSTAAGLLAYRKYQIREAKKIQTSNIPLSGGNPELTNSVAKITSLSSELREKINEIQELANSKDPLSYSFLVTNAIKSNNPNILSSAQSAIVNRLRKSSYPLAARELAQWLSYSQVKPKENLYQKVLGALDPSIPEAKRKELLEQITKQDLNIATRLTAALYFDQNLQVDYKKLFIKQIGEPYNIKATDKLSALALIIYHDKLQEIFSDHIIKSLPQLTEIDLKFMLPKVYTYDLVMRRAVLKQAIKKELLSKESSLFLKAASSNNLMNVGLQKVLIKIATSAKVEFKDLQKVNDWRDPQTEKLLITALSLLKDNKDKIRLFDILLNRKIKSMPAKSLIGFVKDNIWSSRVKYMSAVVKISFSDNYTEAEIIDALKVFKNYFSNSSFQDIISYQSGGVVGDIFVKNFLSKISLTQKIKLLQHPDVNIRKYVMDKIETNDVGGIKMITEAYRLEKIPELQELYKEKFWFIGSSKPLESNLIDRTKNIELQTNSVNRE